MKRKLKVNDFFCGCGGMGIAFKNAGYEIAGAWDFDKYAVESYRANVGDHVQKADIKELHQADIPQADVWAFGFPCQDLSVAGKQRGMILKCEDCGEGYAHIFRCYAWNMNATGTRHILKCLIPNIGTCHRTGTVTQ